MKHVKEHEIAGERFEAPHARIIKHLAAPWTMGTQNLWLGVSKVDPMSKSNPHTHAGAEEIFYVISGHGQILVGEEKEDIEPGSCVYIAPGVEHQLINTNDETLKLVAVTSPPFTQNSFDDAHQKA